MSIDERKIGLIVERVVKRLESELNLNTPQAPSTPHYARASTDAGQFRTVDDAVEAATKAQRYMIDTTLETRDKIIDAMRRVLLDHNEEFSRMAVEETGLGRVEDKIKKNRLAALKTPGTEVLQPRAWSGDEGLTLTERAPYGVIASITPCTNPTETIINNAIGMIAGGNSVVFNVHPAAKGLSNYFVGMLNDAITSNGGPENLVCSIREPTIESAQTIMKHPGTRLVVVTGGGAVVREAMSSGKRAVAAGPGNPPVVVDETADIAEAAQGIIDGATLDNNLICICEKEIIAVEDIADSLKRELKNRNAIEVKGHDIRRLEKVIITPDGHINRDYIGKNANVILAQIGIRVGDDVRMAFCEVDEKHPFVQLEQLMPVFGFVRVPDVDEGILMARRVEHNFRHTAVMYSHNIEALHKMARHADCSIFVKNAPSHAGLGMGGEGYTSWTIASPTGEGLTCAIHFTRERRCTLKHYFRIV